MPNHADKIFELVANVCTENYSPECRNLWMVTERQHVRETVYDNMNAFQIYSVNCHNGINTDQFSTMPLIISCKLRICILIYYYLVEQGNSCDIMYVLK